MKLGMIMSPIADINITKDTSFAMLLEGERRGFELFYLNDGDILVENGEVFAQTRRIRVFDDKDKWFELEQPTLINLAQLDLILLRTDPPFDNNYLYLTQILDLVSGQGVLVINNPSAVRSFNEKLVVERFPELAPPTLVTSSLSLLRRFLAKHESIIVKPLDAMGGSSIFQVKHNDLNAKVIFETITANGTVKVMAQKYIPQVMEHGDKRIILINGKPVPYALARIPANDDFRGNLIKGASARGVELNRNDRKICAELSCFLQQHGLFFTGIDVIGGFLTEINVTSPTGARELDRKFGLNICGMLFDELPLA